MRHILCIAYLLGEHMTLDMRPVGTVSDNEIMQRFMRAINFVRKTQHPVTTEVLAVLESSSSIPHPFAGWAATRHAAVSIINLIERQPDWEYPIGV
jgi:hypothetical protein